MSAHGLAGSAAGGAAALGPVVGAAGAQVDAGVSRLTEAEAAAGGADLPSGAVADRAVHVSAHSHVHVHTHAHAGGGEDGESGNAHGGGNRSGCGYGGGGGIRGSGGEAALAQASKAVGDAGAVAGDAFVAVIQDGAVPVAVAPSADALAASLAEFADGGLRGGLGGGGGCGDDAHSDQTGG